MSELDVQQVGKRSYRICLEGHDPVVVRSDDRDTAIARGIEMLSENTGQTIIARQEGDIVIDVPKFAAASKATAPTASKKG